MTKQGIEKIRAADLQVDPDLQRALVRAKAEAMQLLWDEDAVGVLVVSRRTDGSNWVMEGQHRHWAGLHRHGPDYQFTCEVHTDLERKQEAQMFMRVNTMRSKPSQYDNFRVSLEAEEFEALAINRTLIGLDLTVGTGAKGTVIGAIAALRRIYADLGEDGLHNTLVVAIQAWGYEAATWDADILQAIAHLLAWREDLDTDRLVKRLTKRGRTTMDPAAWKRSGQEIAAAGGSTSRARAIARIMAEAYNAKLADELKIVPTAA